jgi:hypothetical protein
MANESDSVAQRLSGEMQTIDLLDQLFARRRAILDDIEVKELCLEAFRDIDEARRAYFCAELNNELAQIRQRLAEVVVDIHEAAAWLLAEQRAAEIKLAQAREQEFFLAKKAAMEIGAA